MSDSTSAVAAAIFPFEQPQAAGERDRRLATAIAISFLVHALTLAAFRSFIPALHIAGEGGAGSLPALQAVLAGPQVESVAEEPPVPEPAIDPELIVPPDTSPRNLALGRPPPSGAAPEGGTRANDALAAHVNTSVRMIPDPAQLGTDYVGQLARRFPKPVQKRPVLLGAPVVDYPLAAVERGLEGRFAAVISVDALGHVGDAKLVAEDAAFGPAMLDALKRMQFSPAQDEGNPVPYWAIVEFVFAIGGHDAPPAVGQGLARRGLAPPRQPSRK